MPGVNDLIPTLKSRLLILKNDSNNKKDSLNNAEEFLDAKVGKRLQMATKIVKDIKDEKLTKSDAITFIKNIEKILKAKRKLTKTDQGRGGGFLAIEDIEKAISYANDESPSMKVILDHLALVL